MPPEVRRALQLQQLQARQAELEKEIAALPKQIAEIEKLLESHTRRLEADKAALAGNLRERKRLEGEIQTVEQKITKLKDQMMSAKTNEQYRAFQNEISHFEHEIRKHEDRILELMEESEPLEANVKKADAELAVEKKHVEGRKSDARERTAVDEKELAASRENEKELRTQFEPSTLEVYARVKKRWGLSVVSEVVDGRCSGCKMMLRPQFFIDLKSATKMVLCENCGRMIFYNPPVDVEAAAGR